MGVDPGLPSLLNLVSVDIEVILVLSKVNSNSINSEVSDWRLILVSRSGDSGLLSVVNFSSSDNVVLSTEVFVSEHSILRGVVHLFSWIIEMLSVLLSVLVVSHVGASNNCWAVDLFVSSHTILWHVLHSLPWVVAVSVWLGKLSETDSDRSWLVSHQVLQSSSSDVVIEQS